MRLLKVEDLSKSWKDFSLKRINFEIQKGEYFVILGPSGAGKTLLLEAIAGIFIPDSGRILLNGEDITEKPPEKREIAYIPQNYGLFDHMKVFDNIAYGLKVRKFAREEIRKQVEEIAKVLDIKHLLDRKVKNLSAGERQRVAIARAIVISPQVILLDEPFSNLDVNLKNKLLREMKRWRRELNFTAIHVTHSFDEALSLGDKLGIMMNGKMDQVGEVKEVFSKPKTEDIARFLGYENILEGHAEGKILYSENIKIELPQEFYGRVRVMIPPQNILISKNMIFSSARNNFKAIVEEFEDLGALIKLKLRVNGIKLAAHLTKASFVDMGIKEDEEVYVSFKSTAIHVF
ncbi:MAG: tungstate ABC transporter ATP-binding protein WtpC [Archaeoglobaceae archaeon]